MMDSKAWAGQVTVVPFRENKGDIYVFCCPSIHHSLCSSFMARTARASVGGMCYHVLNRGNGRMKVFRKDGDYQAFLKAMAHATVEVPMRVLAYCLLPKLSRSSRMNTS